MDNQTIEVLFGGGAGGGKTELGCNFITIGALQYQESRWMLGRSVLSNLKKSTLLTLFDVFRKNGLKKDTHYNYNQQDNIIRMYNGSEIYLFDLDYYPSDPNYDRIGSTEFTGAFIDEVNQVTFKAKEVVKSRLRYKLEEYKIQPKLFMSCNPTKNWVYQEIYKPWREGRLSPEIAFIQALAKDNPYLSKSYIKMLEGLKDRVLRERLWFGNWEYEDNEHSLFLIDDITDLFTNALKDQKELYLTVDVARFGKDKTVYMVWKGMQVIAIETNDRTSITDITTRIQAFEKQYQIPRSHVLVDEDGVGGGVVDILKCKGFVGNSSAIQNVTNEKTSQYKVNYQNLRSQCYYELSDAVKSHNVSIQGASVEIKQFITEDLESIKAKDVDKDGKLKIISKDEIKEHLQRSTDFGDALMMRMWFNLQKTDLTIRFL